MKPFSIIINNIQLMQQSILLLASNNKQIIHMYSTHLIVSYQIWHILLLH